MLAFGVLMLVNTPAGHTKQFKRQSDTVLGLKIVTESLIFCRDVKKMWVAQLC